MQQHFVLNETGRCYEIPFFSQVFPKVFVIYFLETFIENSSKPAQLRVKWKSGKDDPSNGGYSEDLLKKMFSKVFYFDNLVFVIHRFFLWLAPL